MQGKVRIMSFSIENIEDNKVLLQYSKQLSQNCYKFTIDFLKLMEHHKNLPNIQPNYLDLLIKNFTYKKIITPRPLCAKILTTKCYAFKCLQCQNEDNSIICIQCFNKSNHQGHSYQKIPVNGGCCDCGDDEKWKIQGTCTDHNKKDIQIQIDTQYNQRFLKQMKYVLYLAFAFSLFPFIKNQKYYFEKYIQAFIKYLSIFNEQSMISNQMTSFLIFSNFTNQPQVYHHEKYYSLKINVFQYLSRFYKMKEFSRLLVDLFIMLFTRPWFKKRLTYEYNILVHKKTLILSSELANISCQIYTSHKIINELLNQNKFPPISVGPLDDEKFQTIADIYSRYYLDIVYLSNLYNNVGEFYMNYHFKNSDICQLSGYEKYVRKQFQESISYYGIQPIYFIRSVEFFTYFHKNYQILKKSLCDIVKYIRQGVYNNYLSYYITKERTLIALLLILTNGKIQQAASNKQLLKQIGIDQQVLYKILQAVLYVIRFYAVNLANRQTVDRYYTFYAFSLYKKPRITLSLDFQIVRFCLLALQNFKLMVIPDNESEQNYNYQGLLTFKQNRMPIDKLIAIPAKFVDIVNSVVYLNDEGAYDRRKALGFLTDYLGLLHELIISNSSSICILNTYKLNNQRQKQLVQFYGRLLKSLDCLKFEQFRQICKVFVNQDHSFLQKFIKQNCIIQNKKISLSKQKSGQFQSVNLSYYKSMKNSQILTSFIPENEKKNKLQKIISNIQNQKANKILIKNIFNSYLIKLVCNAVERYLQIFNQYPQIIDVDAAIFEKFIEQLIKINYNLNSLQFKNVFLKVKDCTVIFKKFCPNIISEILKIIEQNQVQQTEMQNQNQANSQKKQKMQEARAKKLQKFKQKQTQTFNSLKYKQSLQMKDSTQQSLYMQCMFCKLSNQQQPLSMLCFKQKSNFFSNFYLGCNRNVNFITSCNHFAHQSCNLTVNQGRYYINCNFCKASSNYLLKINQIKKYQQESQDNLYDSGNQQINQMKDQQSRSRTKFNLCFGPQIYGTKESPKRKTQNQNKHIIMDSDSPIQTIATQILFGAIIDYQFFVKSLAKPCCFILRDLTSNKEKIDQLIESLQTTMKISQLNEENKMFWNVYMFTILSVASLLAIQSNKFNQRWDIRELQKIIPEQLTKNILFILTVIKNVESLKQLQQQKLITYHLPNLRKLPLQLQQLSQEIGSCPSCSRITNQICLCMLCNFKSCVGCEVQSLTKHVSKMHGQSSIFIRVDEGWPLYVSNKKNRYFEQIYLNFMAEPYSIFKGQNKNKSEYKLDEVSYSKIKTDLIRHRIEQQIRYIELKTSKISQLNP